MIGPHAMGEVVKIVWRDDIEPLQDLPWTTHGPRQGTFYYVERIWPEVWMALMRSDPTAEEALKVTRRHLTNLVNIYYKSAKDFGPYKPDLLVGVDFYNRLWVSLSGPLNDQPPKSTRIDL